MSHYDAIVIGGGPSGSTTAYRLAAAGAAVLLADKARFPRDKPCGGGLTIRALRYCPVDPAPVVETLVDEVEIRFRYGDSVARRASSPVIWMTQRRRLDAFLLDQARERGVEVREGVRAWVEADNVVVLDGERLEADVLVGADGANGVTARAVGLGDSVVQSVALEGNLSRADYSGEWPDGKAVVELGDVPGGYAWVFPKQDHLNFGVWGWEHEGPKLRDHLRRVCEVYGVDPEQLTNLRGHRLPMRRPANRIAAERVLLVGDAAGLIDPVSGDGMYECFVSSWAASQAILDLLAGRSSSLAPYAAEVNRALGPLHSASWRIKKALDRWPRASWQVVRTKLLWGSVQNLMQGDIAHPGEQDGAAAVPLRLLNVLGR